MELAETSAERHRMNVELRPETVAWIDNRSAAWACSRPVLLDSIPEWIERTLDGEDPIRVENDLAERSRKETTKRRRLAGRRTSDPINTNTKESDNGL